MHGDLGEATGLEKHLDLGDERRVRRATAIVRSIAREPGQSFPQIFQSKAALEGFYRFANNEAVEHEAIIAGVGDQTVARSRALETVLAIHDTTTFVLDGEVEGAGRIQGRKRGFFGHFALAAKADGERRPLGVLGAKLSVRKKAAGRGKLSTAALAKIPYEEKESYRWAALVDEVEARAAGRVQLVHVGDREADSYPLLSHLVQRNLRFVVRVSKDRSVETSAGTVVFLKASMEQADVICTRMVPLSRRAAQTFKNGLPRSKGRTEREAKLAISVRAVTFLQSRHWRGTTLPALKVNVIRVSEQGAPDGEEPVDWMLATTEDVSTPEQVERIVDMYRSRWLIEEFFKAIKTGCQFEKRQFESIEAFQIVLGLLLPVAAHLLELRVLARAAPDRPAGEFCNTVRIAAIRHILPSYKLPQAPTLRETMLAIAAIGGHLKNNGEPGWIVLGRGFEDLLKIEQAWAAALRSVDKM